MQLTEKRLPVFFQRLERIRRVAPSWWCGRFWQAHQGALLHSVFPTSVVGRYCSYHFDLAGAECFLHTCWNVADSGGIFEQMMQKLLCSLFRQTKLDKPSHARRATSQLGS